MNEMNQSWEIVPSVPMNNAYVGPVPEGCFVTNRTAVIEKNEKRIVIGVFWSNRSEEGILRPVINELKRWFTVEEYKVPDEPYEVIDYLTSLDAPLPDYAIVPYDRPPMAMVAFMCYHNKIPIIQLHAGDISSGTFDDIDRWIITLYADYHFCAGPTQRKRVRKFLRTMGREPQYLYTSGVTNLDDINDMSEPPDGDYDVVIYNVPTKCPEKIADELGDIVNRLDKETYWVEPQGNTEDDKHILARAKDFARTTGKTITVVPTMPHESLLGLLSRAKRVIGNSSCLFFEAPYFGCEIVQIGERNRIRENVELKPGGSKRIARKLKKWLV